MFASCEENEDVGKHFNQSLYIFIPRIFIPYMNNSLPLDIKSTVINKILGGHSSILCEYANIT